MRYDSQHQKGSKSVTYNQVISEGESYWEKPELKLGTFLWLSPGNGLGHSLPALRVADGVGQVQLHVGHRQAAGIGMSGREKFGQ